MLYGIAKLLTLLSVLFHAGMGCCAHHDHCSESRADAVGTQSPDSQSPDHCSCSFHAHSSIERAIASDSDEADPGGCPCGESHGVCSDHCSWLTNSRVELPADYGLILPFSLIDRLALNSSDAALVARALHAGPPLLSELTDPLRAKTQVWRL